jgi:hypothetical protein
MEDRSGWMRRSAWACSLLAGACAAPPAVQQPAPVETAGFVTRLGVDTIAVERFTLTPYGMRAEAMLRVPETTYRVYELTFGDDGGPGRLVVERYDPAAGAGGPLARDEVLLTPAAPLPFIDMIHWPFELMLRRVVAAGADSMMFPLRAGRGALPFVIARAGAGRYTATHPTRGTMDVAVDAAGRIQALDASRTTRALRVTRVPDADVAAAARRFAAEGRPMGELSGRGEVQQDVAGATITVDYGVPLKRGREIFGALVPWAEVWRTGANRATHFSTTRDLVAGTARIPAGSYTLFTIPRPEAWTLMVNSRTGINGQSYDPAADVVHVAMATRPLDTAVEAFTILVEDAGGGRGVLRMQWDRVEALVEFGVVE